MSGTRVSARLPEAHGIRGLLIDIDGVLTIRGEPIDGAAQALDELRRRGIPFRLLTNTTMRSRAELAGRLQKVGISAQGSEIYTASFLAATYLRRRGVRRAWVLLYGSAYDDFADLELTEENPQYVVLGDLGDDFNARTMNRIYRALLGGARLVAVQHNAAWMAPDGPRLDVGAWVAALEFASGEPALVMGKPSLVAYEFPTADMGLRPEQVAMVSDDPDVDLAGARAARLKTVFVRTSAAPQRRRVRRGEFDCALNSIADLPSAL